MCEEQDVSADRVQALEERVKALEAQLAKLMEWKEGRLGSGDHFSTDVERVVADREQRLKHQMRY
ncbi:MAG: hypothetical protein FJX75_09875 [Armatimonadetes bacterium]|nr:hypothetical protein [Armatimonadota bacterium]